MKSVFILHCPRLGLVLEAYASKAKAEAKAAELQAGLTSRIEVLERFINYTLEG